VKNLEKLLIPKPKKIDAKGNIIRLANGKRRLFTLVCEGADDRISEGAALIKKRIDALSPYSSGEGEYKITLKVDGRDEKLCSSGEFEAYYIETAP
jgi:hypothetical protein